MITVIKAKQVVPASQKVQRSPPPPPSGVDSSALAMEIAGNMEAALARWSQKKRG